MLDVMDALFQLGNALRVPKGKPRYEFLVAAEKRLDDISSNMLAIRQRSKRYDKVPAGMTKTNGVWASLNLMDDTPVANTSIWESMNEAFIAARVAAWKSGVNTYFSVLSLQFHQAIIKLLAGTDNRSKNTYYVLDPTTLKIHLHADDLDTILRTNNTGWQMKPYYIEEHDTDEAGNTFWEGQYNVLFKLTELAYAEALPQMMNTILSRMAQLVGSGQRDRAGNIIPQTPEGCFQKYFFGPSQASSAATPRTRTPTSSWRTWPRP